MRFGIGLAAGIIFEATVIRALLARADAPLRPLELVAAPSVARALFHPARAGAGEDRDRLGRRGQQECPCAPKRATTCGDGIGQL